MEYFKSGLNDTVGQVQELIPGFGDRQAASRDAARAAEALKKRIHDEWKKPVFDRTPLTPEEFRVLQQYEPQIAAFVEQQAPEMLKNVRGEGRQAQLKALSELGQLADTGSTPGTRAAFEEANLTADQAMRSRRQNAIANLEAKGLAGTAGATLGADIGAGLAATEQQRLASLEQAKQEQAAKLQALNSLGAIGGQVEGQDERQQEINNQNLNNYYLNMADKRQKYNNYVAATQNQGQLYNIQQNQQNANMNTSQKNEYAKRNQEYHNKLEQADADNSNDELRLESGLDREEASRRYKEGIEGAQDKTKLFMNMIGAGAALYGAGGGGGGDSISEFKGPGGAPVADTYLGGNQSTGQAYV